MGRPPDAASYDAAHAGDPRGHPVRRVAATTSPTCRSPSPTGPPSCAATRQTMFEGLESEDKDPRKSLHVDDVATPELAPDEVYVAVMASAINFNTVWTSIFEPLPTFGFLDRLGKEIEWGARHALPYHVVGSDASRRRAPGRLGRAQLEAGRPGHRPLQPRRRPGPVAPTTTRCSPPTSASGASRPTSAAWPTSRWSRPTSSCPSPPTSRWEEAACNALCNSTSYRMLVIARTRAAMKQGDVVLIWGAIGRPRRLRRAVRPQRRRHAGRRGVVGRQGRPAARARLRGASSTARRPATSSGPTSTPRTRRSGAGSARTSAASSATTPTSCSSTPAARPWARRCSSCARGGTIVTCAATSRLHDRVRQPPPLDEAEDASSQLALRQLPRGVGRQPADLPRARSSRSSRPCTRSTDVGEAAYAVHKNLHEGKIGVLCLAPEEGARHRRPRASASKVGEDKITLFRRHGA